jgi:hemerythrin-like domain-containing protein
MDRIFSMRTTRQRFIRSIASGLVSTCYLLRGEESQAFSLPLPSESDPLEDLMQEHGVLSRLLMIYDELGARLEKNEPDPDDCLFSTTKLIEDHIQKHHERIEELAVFPFMKTRGLCLPLMRVLVEQHGAGSHITRSIRKKLSGADKSKTRGKTMLRRDLAELVRAFVKMYRPHAAREDTVLYPALRCNLEPDRYTEFKNRVEHLESAMKESRLDTVLSRIEEIEKALDLFDLANFTYKKDAAPGQGCPDRSQSVEQAEVRTN